MDIQLCIVLHHGGKWEYNPNLCYIGGQVKLINDIPLDFNAIYFKSLIDSLGYDNVIKLHYYCDPLKNLQTGVRFLAYEDCTFAKFKSLLSEFKIIDVFTEHDDEGHRVCGNATPGFRAGETKNQTHTPVQPFFTTKPVHTEHQPADYVEPETETTNLFNLGNDIDYDEEGSDEVDVEVMDVRERLKETSKVELEFLNELDSLNRVAGRLGDRKGQDADHVDDGDASSEYESLSNSDDDDYDECGFLLPQPGKKKKRVIKQTSHLPFPTHSEIESPFYLGHKFKDIVELREAITTYFVSIGRDIEYVKNDKTRIGAKCKARERGCPWYLWASMSGNGTLSVKTHIPQHTTVGEWQE
uniref:Transposase MuDR plant domain-containing protein n=1 Tax=Chenopodium quinoa TaxID=63459 RepID=A0A803MBQ7_CHEQI